MGTTHLMEAVRHVDSVKAVVVVTTDKVYENQEWAWAYREQDRLGGLTRIPPARPAPSWW